MHGSTVRICDQNSYLATISTLEIDMRVSSISQKPPAQCVAAVKKGNAKKVSSGQILGMSSDLLPHNRIACNKGRLSYTLIFCVQSPVPGEEQSHSPVSTMF